MRFLCLIGTLFAICFPRESLWAQTRALPPVTLVSEEQACGHWRLPLVLEVPVNRRFPLRRLGELIAEDVSNAQATTAIQADTRAYTFPRLQTERTGSEHATSLDGLVHTLLRDADTSTQAALVERLRTIVRTTDARFLSIEERRSCCIVRDADGLRRCLTPANGLCENGTLPARVSRNRSLVATASFTNSFLHESFVVRGAINIESWQGAPGYDFRVFLKTRAQQGFRASVPRLYTEHEHPRPGAILCQEFSRFASLPVPTSAEAKRLLLRRMAHLLHTTIAEGDISGAEWGALMMGSISERFANLAVLERAEASIARLEQRNEALAARLASAEIENAILSHSRAHWRVLAKEIALGSCVALIGSLLAALWFRRVTRTRDTHLFLHRFEQELLAWVRFVHLRVPKHLLEEHPSLLSLRLANIGEQISAQKNAVHFFQSVRELVESLLMQAQEQTYAFQDIFLHALHEPELAGYVPTWDEAKGFGPEEGQSIFSFMLARLRTSQTEEMASRQKFETVDTRARKLQEVIRKLQEVIQTATGLRDLQNIDSLLIKTIMEDPSKDSA